MYYIYLFTLISLSNLIPITVHAKEYNISQVNKIKPQDNIYHLTNSKLTSSFDTTEYTHFNVILGQARDTSITVNLLVNEDSLIYCEYGLDPDNLFNHSTQINATAKTPIELSLSNLMVNTQYYYRIIQQTDEAEIHYGNLSRFHTQRDINQTFSFGVQGDSHPERNAALYNKELYQQHINNIAENQPDLFFMLGDDFSIESLMLNNTLTQESVNEVYAEQREYLQYAMNNTALYLVNGNHEQAARYIYDGNFDYDDNYPDLGHAPQYAANARNQYYSLPAPDDFYTGDHTQLDNIGFLRDYYAWQWGDALFVTLDPYWHSPEVVDSGIPPLYEKSSNTWAITMGDEQYTWLQQTLSNSEAKYKFVFAHHINGRGRGAAGIVHNNEWGGYDKKGNRYEFDEYRSNWSLPIHQLMVENDVTIFFQGHDHVFAKEVVDGLIYQSLPSPADNSEDSWLKYADYYAPESITLPNAQYDPNQSVVLPPSGYVNVTVAADKVTVNYVASILPEDETDNLKNGDIIYQYDVIEAP